jgi:acetamidase/formamidase
MGDGEIAGTAIEVSMRVRLQVDVVKGQKIGWPRFENNDYRVRAGQTQAIIQRYKQPSKRIVQPQVKRLAIKCHSGNSLAFARCKHKAFVIAAQIQSTFA